MKVIDLSNFKDTKPIEIEIDTKKQLEDFKKSVTKVKPDPDLQNLNREYKRTKGVYLF